ncbi:zinc finger, GRF-type containing protein [Tanacetum coccineum]
MVRCSKCDSVGVIRTSWTSENPGRRFYCCSKRKFEVHSCIFFPLPFAPAVFFIGDILFANVFVNLGVTKGAVGLRKGGVCLLEGALGLTEGATGLRGGVGLTNVCDWLTVGAEGVT